VFTFAFNEEQFKIVVAMNRKPVWSLLRAFLEYSNEYAGTECEAVGIVGKRVNGDFAPHQSHTTELGENFKH
jgi:hypothetical protein